jgi:hypothetical protein
LSQSSCRTQWLASNICSISFFFILSIFAYRFNDCCGKDNLFLHPSQLPTTFFRSFSFDLTFIRSSWCNSIVKMAFALPRMSHNLAESVYHFKGAAVARQFRQHYREPYDLRRLQRVGNRSRMHGLGRCRSVS